MARRTAVATLVSIMVASTAGGEGVPDPQREGVCGARESLPLKVKLNNGIEVSRIGYGTAGLGHATEESVWLALEAGYRNVDTAQAWEWYREEAVGRAVKRATRASARSASDASSEQGERLDEGEEVPDGPPSLSRDDVFVTTKVHPRDFGADRLGAMIDSSRNNLNGVDLVLLHSPYCWPDSCPDSPTPWQDAWRSLEDLYMEGTVRAIGVSNFSVHLLRELLGMARVVPAAVQNWMDPFHQDRAVRALCAERGITYISYSTLGGQWTYRSSPPPPNPVSTDATLGAIAEAHGISPQAVTLAWAMQSGAVVLPRSSNPQRIRENLRGFLESSVGECAAESVGEKEGEERVALILSSDEMEAISKLDGTLDG